MLRRNILSIAIMCFAVLSGNDYGSIATSRPGSANPTSAVPSGLFQFEFGINSDMDTTYTYPFLLRLGIYDNSELQLNYVSNVLTLGFLFGGINLFDRLESSILLTTSMTENDDDLTDYNIYLPIAYSFSNSISTWGQISVLIPKAEGLESIISYSLAIGGGLSDKMGWFGEIYGYGTPSSESLAIDGGITYLINDQMQIDFSVGESLDDSELKFIEFGFSCRLPK